MKTEHDSLHARSGQIFRRIQAPWRPRPNLGTLSLLALAGLAVAAAPALASAPPDRGRPEISPPQVSRPSPPPSSPSGGSSTRSAPAPRSNSGARGGGSSGSRPKYSPPSGRSSSGKRSDQGRQPRAIDRKFSGDWGSAYEERRRGGGHGRPGHGSHGGRGGHYGHHYDYPRVSHYSYYPSAWWWWSYPYSYRYGYGHYGYGRYGYDHYGYSRYGYAPYSYGRSRHHYGDELPLGALDLDIRPEKAAIYIDGEYKGVADNFDGFPSYLWLEEGTYNLVVFKEGFETIARKVTVYPGLTIDISDRMPRGEATSLESLPEEYRKPSEATVRNRQEREERIARKESEWRDRARSYRQRKDGGSDGTVQPPLRRGADENGFDAREEPGRLFLNVEPGDASIYLDGRFLGTAAELSRLHAGLIVDPGEHVLEVVRPGYTSDSESFAIDSGEDLKVRVDLSRGGDTRGTKSQGANT